MGYGRVMGFEVKIPANQVGIMENVWVTRDYGLSELWVMRASTVRDLRIINSAMLILKKIRALTGEVPNACLASLRTDV